MKILMMIAIIAAGAGVASARLGENITQCDQRYNSTGGNISKDFIDNHSKLITGINTTNVVYIYDGWKIKIGYMNSYAVVIEYKRLDGGRIDNTQLGMILRVNCGDQTWAPNGMFNWTGSRGAGLYNDGHRVRLESPAYKQFNDSKQGQRQAPSPGLNL